jgi:hypothetical protein
VNYIEHGPANGAVALGAPATRVEAGPFQFPSGDGGSYTSASSFDADFDGSVHFTGHDGVLDLTIADPRVTVEGTHGTLVVDASSKSQETGELDVFDDVALADLDLSGVQATADGDEVTLADVPASLTEDGAPAFGGFYAAGDALDPVTLVLQVDGGDTELPVATTPKVTCLDATTVTAGDTVRLCGEGFLPGEQVQAFLHSDPVLLGLTTAASDGHVDVTVTVPHSTPAGTHHLELRGVSSGLSLLSDAITVVAAPGETVTTPSATGTGTDTGTLAATGADSRGLAAGALLLVLAGALAVAATRRRDLAG